MAPVTEAYLPSLDKCFSGNVQLLSWTRAFLFTCNADKYAEDAQNIHLFLSHPESFRLLSQCLNPFTAPTPTTKSDFESKSSAIHATTAQVSYDLKELKADVLWLSENASIDETTALRITVLEWQSRPSTCLLARFSKEEISSLEEAAGVDHLRTSAVGDYLAEHLRQKGTESKENTDFASKEKRRLRLRRVYLEERCHILKTSRKLLSLSINENVPDGSPLAGTENEAKLRSLGLQIFQNRLKGKGWLDFLRDSIDAVRKRLKDLEGDGGWLGLHESSEEIDDLWRTTVVEEITHLVQILFILLQASSQIPNSELVLSWLQLMAEYDFLESIQVVCEDPLEILLPLQALTCLTTLTFLKLPLSISFLINRNQLPQDGTTTAPYFLSKDLGQLNEIFLSTAFELRTAGPAAFAWGLVLYTMRELALQDKESRELEQFHSAVNLFQSNMPNATSAQGPEQSLYEELLDCARTSKYRTEDSILHLTADNLQQLAFDTISSLAIKVSSMSAIDDNTTACQARLALLDLIRVAVFYSDYSPEILGSVLAILEVSPAASTWRPNTLLPSALDPKYVFLKDSLLIDKVFRTSRSRFPYEAIPFLKLCRAVITNNAVNEEGLPWILEELENMETFTQVVPVGFHGYETVREDENANFVSLTQPLPMFRYDSKRKMSNHEGHELTVTTSSIVPTAALGQVVLESKPAVVMWQHRYSCLTYFGSLLEEWNENGEHSSHDENEVVVETLGLFADLIGAAKQAQRDHISSAKRILEMASDGLDRSSDIISIIFGIFERDLQHMGSRSSSSNSLDSVIVCLKFIRELVTVLPNRVWPLLSRSSLLGSDGKGGMMATIISAVEVPSGEYPFLLSCVDLFEAIVEDAASRAVMRRCPSNALAKTASASDWSAGIPARVVKNILLNFVRAMIEVFSSSAMWRFNEAEQRLKVDTKLSNTFAKIIYYAYGTNDEAELDAKITGMFSWSAEYLLGFLRPNSMDDMTFNPIFRLVADGLRTPRASYLRYLNLMEQQVTAVLDLSMKLLQAAHLSNQPPSLLESQLFKATPVLIRLYALRDTYRLPVLSLLDMMVSSAARDTANEPPSLVGHLGAASSCLFLDIISQFEKPLSSRPLLLAIWHLLSTLVSKRQQWLAVYILTGSSPRESLKKNNKQTVPMLRGAPFLQIALDALSHIEQLDSQLAASLLEFVSFSQENWPWATPQLRQHPKFFNSIINYVAKLQVPKLPVVDQIFTSRIAAVVADLCAVHLQFAKETHDRTFIKTLIPLVSWYAKDAVEVSGYNASLHANLKKNFEMRYTGCKLVDFKRTSLETRSLGRNYYYDIGLGEKLLSYDFAWRGNRNQGFAEEFERANLNLSLVDARATLLQSWKFFAIEHCAYFMFDREIQKAMAAVARNCLSANIQTTTSGVLFDRIQQARADFAQALLQRLVKIGAHGSEVFGLLNVVWEAMRARHATYEDALVNDDVKYYRTLLNVLFLALQFHIDGSSTKPEPLAKQAEISSDSTLVAELVHKVVAPGFKTLTMYLHEQPEKCAPGDFAILTAILQSCLQVKNVDRLYEHIVFHIEDNDIARHATALFSWSDRLTVAGDPVYGDLSMSFLVKLSTIPTLAEYLAVEGVLPKISSCRLTNFLRQPKGCGPFDPVPRLHSIWAGGILPLCLNLLYHVMRTAPEVAAFLNQFAGQLKRAAECFAGKGRTIDYARESAGRICLSMASEAYSLSLISFILDRFRDAGPSAGIESQSIQELKWDRAQVKEDIEELLERRAALRARIVATSEKEVEWAQQKPRDPVSGAENRLEEKIAEELSAAVICLRGGEEG